MNSIHRNPCWWAAPVNWNSLLVNESKIDKTLRQLYGFNLWFAAERSMNDIRHQVVRVLLTIKQKLKWLDTERDCVVIESLRISIADEVQVLLTNDEISKRAEEFSDYKRWVEERAARGKFESSI